MKKKVFYLNIWFETRKVWNGWFSWRKTLVLKEKYFKEFSILRKNLKFFFNGYPCKHFTEHIYIFFFFRTFLAFFFHLRNFFCGGRSIPPPPSLADASLYWMQFFLNALSNCACPWLRGWWSSCPASPWGCQPGRPWWPPTPRCSPQSTMYNKNILIVFQEMKKLIKATKR